MLIQIDCHAYDAAAISSAFRYTAFDLQDHKLKTMLLCIADLIDAAASTITRHESEHDERKFKEAS